jgi:acyl-CoA synthetase (AMP-forming)/AMP-acid ligase II
VRAVLEISGQVVGEAAVRPRPRANPTEDELVELCRTNLAGYKKPHYFRFVSDLLKIDYGKNFTRERTG